jgi:hypothetical protein
MQMNFVLLESVAIQFNGQYFDLHNCYDLTVLAFDASKKHARLIFTYLNDASGKMPNHEIEILFEEVDHWSHDSPQLPCDIMELGYKDPTDFDHECWSETSCNKEDHLLFRLSEKKGAFVRVHALKATACLLGSQQE